MAESYPIYSLCRHPELVEQAAEWFHAKWGISKQAYLDSMRAMFAGDSPVPQWFVMMDGEAIIAGLGVIENDFHDRPDLTPNVCAVYVEKAYRCRGIAGQMLQTACDAFAAAGIDTLYLLTDHTSFYERYGWEFLCMAQGEGEDEPSRMYVKKTILPHQA